MAVETGCTKEAAEKVLKNELENEARAYDIRTLLQDYFERLPKEDSGKCEGKPQAPNILDEVIEAQISLRCTLSDIAGLIKSAVINKIV